MNAKVGYCGLRVQAEVHTELSPPLAQIPGSVAASMARGGAPCGPRHCATLMWAVGQSGSPAWSRAPACGLCLRRGDPGPRGWAARPGTRSSPMQRPGPCPRRAASRSSQRRPAEGQGRCVCTFERECHQRKCPIARVPGLKDAHRCLMKVHESPPSVADAIRRICTHAKASKVQPMSE
jgi:hypothetical protein